MKKTGRWPVFFLPQIYESQATLRTEVESFQNMFLLLGGIALCHYLAEPVLPSLV